jgi:eukaryotic-like serine/threonine-protein kinase
VCCTMTGVRAASRAEAGGDVREGERVSGRYRLDGRLGRGARGEVWTGFDSQLGREVAVKLLLETDAGRDQLQRFREAMTGAPLRHPGITVVHDVGRHDDQLFIVMELLEGENLAQLVHHSPGGLPVQDAVALALQAAEALAAAHAGKLVHRDLKPANLFLLEDGRLKICDFGIAYAADATHQVTAANQQFGTPNYLAPEQWRSEVVDAKCDLYALGCVLFELLTGATLFSSEGRGWTLMHRHLEETPPAVRSVRADVPVAVEELVASLLAKDPADRPDSATTVDLLRAIQQPAVGEHSAPPETLPRPNPEAGTSAEEETRTTPVPTIPEPAPAPAAPAESHSRHGRTRRAIAVAGFSALAAGVTWALWPSSTQRKPPESSRTPITTPSAVETLGFSPDGRILAALGQDGVVRTWDMATHRQTGAPIRVFDGPYDASRNSFSFAFSSDGRTLTTANWGSDDPTQTFVRSWKVAGQRRTGRTFTVPGGFWNMWLSRDARTLAVVQADGVQLWDTDGQRRTGTLPGPISEDPPATFSPDGRTLVTRGRAKDTLAVWDLDRRQQIGSPIKVGDKIDGLAFSPDGNTLAFGDGDAVRLVDADRRRLIGGALGSSLGDVYGKSFTSDGRSLAAAGAAGTATLWDVADQRQIGKAFGQGVKDVSFRPHSRVLAIAGSDHTIRFRTVPAGG